jgi:hypothetical protein
LARITWLLLVGAVFLFAPSTAPAAEPYTRVGTVEGVTEYKLPNGLRVLLLRDESKPLVTVSCAVLVGSRHEGYGETGMIAPRSRPAIPPAERPAAGASYTTFRFRIASGTPPGSSPRPPNRPRLLGPGGAFSCVHDRGRPDAAGLAQTLRRGIGPGRAG